MEKQTHVRGELVTSLLGLISPRSHTQEGNEQCLLREANDTQQLLASASEQRDHVTGSSRLRSRASREVARRCKEKPDEFSFLAASFYPQFFYFRWGSSKDKFLDVNGGWWFYTRMSVITFTGQVSLFLRIKLCLLSSITSYLAPCTGCTCLFPSLFINLTGCFFRWYSTWLFGKWLSKSTWSRLFTRAIKCYVAVIFVTFLYLLWPF